MKYSNFFLPSYSISLIIRSSTLNTMISWSVKNVLSKKFTYWDKNGRLSSEMEIKIYTLIVIYFFEVKKVLFNFINFCLSPYNLFILFSHIEIFPIIYISNIEKSNPRHVIHKFCVYQFLLNLIVMNVFKGFVKIWAPHHPFFLIW